MTYKNLNQSDIELTKIALNHSIDFYGKELGKLEDHYQSCKCDSLANAINEQIKSIECNVNSNKQLIEKLG